jgi:hypothetical protein
MVIGSTEVEANRLMSEFRIAERIRRGREHDVRCPCRNRCTARYVLGDLVLHGPVNDEGGASRTQQDFKVQGRRPALCSDLWHGIEVH